MERSIETTGLPARLILVLLLTALLLAGGLYAAVQPGLAADPPDTPMPTFTVLDGEPISVAELAQESWVLAFVILPGCPACEQVITWFGLAAQAFPEINFLLVTPAATLELVATWRATFVEEHAINLRVLVDQGGILGTMLGVERAPTVFLTVNEMHIDRLDWPFTEPDFLSAAAEMVELPDPAQLVGQPALFHGAHAYRFIFSPLILILRETRLRANKSECMDILKV